MVLCSSCEYTTPKSTAISILADRTDTYITFPKTNDVLNLLDIDASPNDGVDLKFQNLGHVDFNPTYSVSLKQSSFLDNDYERKSEIKRFSVSDEKGLLRFRPFSCCAFGKNGLDSRV